MNRGSSLPSCFWHMLGLLPFIHESLWHFLFVTDSKVVRCCTFLLKIWHFDFSLLCPACEAFWPLCVFVLIYLFTPLSFKCHTQPSLCCSGRSGPPTMTMGLVCTVNHFDFLSRGVCAKSWVLTSARLWCVKRETTKTESELICALCVVRGLSGQTLLLIKLSRVSQLLYI